MRMSLVDYGTKEAARIKDSQFENEVCARVSVGKEHDLLCGAHRNDGLIQ